MATPPTEGCKSFIFNMNFHHQSKNEQNKYICIIKKKTQNLIS